MIYANKQRAMEVAQMLNDTLRGHAPSAAYRIAEGWTVIASYVQPTLGQFGILEFAEVI